MPLALNQLSFQRKWPENPALMMENWSCWAMHPTYWLLRTANATTVPSHNSLDDGVMSVMSNDVVFYIVIFTRDGMTMYKGSVCSWSPSHKFDQVQVILPIFHNVMFTFKQNGSRSLLGGNLYRLKYCKCLSISGTCLHGIERAFFRLNACLRDTTCTSNCR